jgi:hypothetical protein
MKLPWCIEEEKRRIAREKEWAEKSKNAIRVRDMEEGDWGYIVPWEFDFETNTPDPMAEIYADEDGTASLWIHKRKEGGFEYHSRDLKNDIESDKRKHKIYTITWWQKLLMKV